MKVLGAMDYTTPASPSLPRTVISNGSGLTRTRGIRPWLNARQVEISSPVELAALSYTWGSSVGISPHQLINQDFGP
jgi:hypothetical protein